jgi:hypothetical protein
MKTAALIVLAFCGLVLGPAVGGPGKDPPARNGPEIKVDEKNRETGTVGAKEGAGTYEVKSYFVQASFQVSYARVPNSFTLIFSRDDATKPPSGAFWMNRTPEAVAAATALMDKAFADKRKVYYSYKADAFSVGIEPDPFFVGPKP